MGTKNTPGTYDCWEKAKPDEPVFVLLGRDPDAPAAIRKWAADREAMVKVGLAPGDDTAKIEEARACAAHMDKYRAGLRVAAAFKLARDEGY